jgi:hypothetical protein
VGAPALTRTRRAALAVGIAAVLVGGVVLLVPGENDWDQREDHDVFATFEDPALADVQVATQALARIRARWAGTPVADLAALPGRRVWACLFRPGDVCGAGTGTDLGASLDAAAAALSQRVDPSQADAVSLVLDVELGTRPMRWPREKRLHDAGIVGLDVGGAVILPREVLTRRLFRAVDDDDKPTWNDDAVQALLTARGSTSSALDGHWLWTATWAEPAPRATPVRLLRLHPFEPDPLTPEHLLDVATEAADHLSSTVGDDGAIRYLYDPMANEIRSGQNLLRHAGTTYSLVQAWQRKPTPAWRDAASRAIRYLLAHSASDVRNGPHGGGLGQYVVEGKDIKLGGAGLALVLLATWESATGDTTFREDARRYATFLVSQQLEDGEFVAFPSRTPGGEPRDDTSAYYPGEATLGLVLLHDLEPQGPWLDAARRGADWLIDVRDRGKGPSRLSNDHWLMIALSHLYVATKDSRYVEHALAIAGAVTYQAKKHAGHERFHPDYRGGYYEPPRGTPAATRAEGLVAVLDTCRAAGRQCPEVRDLLLATVSHLLQARYRPDLLGWSADPQAISGAFPGGITDPLVRNDYTQHALSAVLGTERLLAGDGMDPRGGPR